MYVCISRIIVNINERCDVSVRLSPHRTTGGYSASTFIRISYTQLPTHTVTEGLTRLIEYSTVVRYLINIIRQDECLDKIVDGFIYMFD